MLTAGWADAPPVAELRELHQGSTWALTILLGGERRGQSADAGNLRTWATRYGLSTPVLMDAEGSLAAAIDELPQVLVVDASALEIVARGPSLVAPAIREALARE